ncbi:hypothetical protein Q1695_008893 [Nippostrongylus brasiliensis]|nr:hypothetical protein Q1695_008893 [Nippostrongylus brasiliensis]
MLGKNLGRVIGPEFIRSEYLHFLKRRKKNRDSIKEKENRDSIKEKEEEQEEENEQQMGEPPSETGRISSRDIETGQDKRELLRRMGVFIRSESNEDCPTEMEKPGSVMRPFICRSPQRKLRWKTMMKPYKVRKKPSKMDSGRKEVVETQKTGDSVEIESKEPVEPDVQTARTAYSDTKTAIPAIEPIKEEYALMKRSKPTEKMSSEPYVEPTPAVERTAPEPAISNVPSEMDVKTARSPFGDRSEDVFSELGEDVDLRQVLMDLDMNTLQGVRADKRLQAMVRRFSPFDEEVLRTLDSVLDKTIEYFINNKIDVLDPEIKNLIKERRALKAAMLDTMLKKPSYVPTEWVKKFEDYHEEALRETSGINWTQIMFLYPRQRTFDDESPDIFGNFTRAQHTNWLEKRRRRVSSWTQRSCVGQVHSSLTNLRPDQRALKRGHNHKVLLGEGSCLFQKTSAIRKSTYEAVRFHIPVFILHTTSSNSPTAF